MNKRALGVGGVLAGLVLSASLSTAARADGPTPLPTPTPIAPKCWQATRPVTLPCVRPIVSPVRGGLVPAFRYGAIEGAKLIK
jgi:hypothetical protein